MQQQMAVDKRFELASLHTVGQRTAAAAAAAVTAVAAAVEGAVPSLSTP